MNIFNYFPGVIAGMGVAFIIGLIIRFMTEGASLRISFVSVFRFFFIPIAAIYIAMKMYKDRRKILFRIKNRSELEDKEIDRIEALLESRFKIFWFLIRSYFNYFRSFIDLYVKASIEFEKQRASKPKSKKQNKFYDQFINEIDVAKHLLNYV